MSDIELRVVNRRQDFAEAAGEWRALVSGVGTRCGIWCDPLVVEETIGFDHGEHLLLAYVRQGDQVVAALPFRSSATGLSISIGLWRAYTGMLRMLRLYDFRFPIADGLDPPHDCDGSRLATPRRCLLHAGPC